MLYITVTKQLMTCTGTRPKSLNYLWFISSSAVLAEGRREEENTSNTIISAVLRNTYTNETDTHTQILFNRTVTIISVYMQRYVPDNKGTSLNGAK
jgi:hypothetical protein